MNSFKTVIVVSVMAVVAYGVYASLTRGPVDPSAGDSDAGPAVEMPSEGGETVQAPAESGFAPKYAANAGGSSHTAENDADEKVHDAEPQKNNARDKNPGRRTKGDRRNEDRYKQSGRYPDTASPGGEPSSPDEDYVIAEDQSESPDDAGAGEGYAEEPEAPMPDLPDFAQAMQDIKAKLDRDQLTVAHRELTRWYDVPELSQADRTQVESLLDKLAGTVIYDGQQHLLGPAYIVREGDTLPQIAQSYDVPWQLLAKINGIYDPQHLQPGQQLKVLRGPFDAVVDLKAFRLTLLLDGCYAGQFPVGVGQDHEITTGEFKVRMKVENPDYSGPSGVIRANDPNNPLGRYLIHLSDEVSIHGTNDPASIGRADGPGSIRLRPEHIEDVFDILSAGSTVVIRP